MKLRARVTNDWFIFVISGWVMSGCYHRRSPAGFCVPCGDVIECVAVEYGGSP